MRVIVKHPGQAPAVVNIGDRYTDLQKALGGPETMPTHCLKDGPVIVWCNADDLKRPTPELNFRRPLLDGLPICGIVVVTGSQMTTGSLTDEQVGRWMYLLVMLDPMVPRRQEIMVELYRDLSPHERSLITFDTSDTSDASAS